MPGSKVAALEHILEHNGTYLWMVSKGHRKDIVMQRGEATNGICSGQQHISACQEEIKGLKATLV